MNLAGKYRFNNNDHEARARECTHSEGITSAPHWGPRVVREMPLAMVGEQLSLNELYRLSWGAKNAHGEEWEKLKAEFDARLEQMRKRRYLRVAG